MQLQSFAAGKWHSGGRDGVALRDAILAVRLPFIELHLSNTQAREPFRKHSYFSDIALGCITGLGALGYELAVRAAAHYVASQEW